MATTLEKVAERTWKRTALGWQLKCRQGEETFTDTNLLDLLISSPRKHKIFKIPKPIEKHLGADWLWYVGRPGAWRAYLVQAKKVEPDGGYKSVYHKQSFSPSWLGISPPVRQLDVLEGFARRFGAMPVYAYFNHYKAAGLPHWHCCQTLDIGQLGCTLSPSSTVKLPGLTGKDGFNKVHAVSETLPWRCIQNCPNINVQTQSKALFRAPEASIIPLDEDADEISLEDFLRRFDFQMEEIPFLPKYVVISTDESEVDEETSI
ncbi:hypothetical protein ACINK0_17050 [Deinococcus sp. VB343]|uniref:hypothetical protein n=1 Tax=Deinococcus sp. VB343 TaxID=3385567 RepID=UPI0039C9440D